MPLLFIDCETTGLPNYSLPVDHPSQPRIVQLAAVLHDDDDDGVGFVASLNAIIRPDGWTVPAAATAVHRITTERAYAIGEPLHDVLLSLLSLIERADPGRLIAHNFNFDHRMLLREASADNMPELTSTVSLLSPFCTMLSLTDRMKLPGRYGKHKWPSLAEAYQYVFAQPSDEPGRHSAMGDVLSCRDIFFEGRRREWWR
jgi:DNA polymerase-3 subunit epsilon